MYFGPYIFVCVGEKAWAKDYPLCGTGKTQSPVNIVTSQVSAFSHGKCRVPEKSIDMADTEVEESDLLDTGHTIEVAIDGKAGTTRGGPLDHSKDFASFFFVSPFFSKHFKNSFTKQNK